MMAMPFVRLKPFSLTSEPQAMVYPRSSEVSMICIISSSVTFQTLSQFQLSGTSIANCV